MINEVLIPFFTIGMAELGDKTQLAILCLASKTKKHLQLLLGVVLAFIIANGLAIMFGGFITQLIPLKYIKIGSGTAFIIFGIITLVNNKEEEAKCEIRTPFSSGFWLIFISEMGDKTQIASGLFAAKFNQLLVLVGVVTALTITSIIAVYCGRCMGSKLSKKTISIAAGVLFILAGVFYIIV